MVRSLYSGVTGMKAHQTRLDVIGNNISNVNTIGFKSSSVTFRDVYYQSIRGAAAGDGTKGGLNPSMIGYGAQVGSIDLNMGQSSSSTTGNPWDVSVGGEGFFQVQDADGNIFYTRAGKLGYDNMGYLIDSNGNYVLGTAAKNNSVVGQKPGSNRIQMTVPNLNPTKANWTNTINGIKYTLSAGKENTDGNVTVNIISKELPAGVPASATVTSTGITVTLGSDYTFADMDELNTAMNDAITTAYGGAHPAGQFTLTADPATGFNNLTGSEICSAQSSPTPGKVTIPPIDLLKNEWGFSFASPATGDQFKAGDGTGAITGFKVVDNFVAGDANHSYTITMTIGGLDYEATIVGSQMTSGRQVQLKGPGGVGDTINLVCPSEKSLIDKSADPTDPTAPYDFTGINSAYTDYSVTPAVQSENLGLASQAFTLKGGTEGGPQSLKDISGFKIGADGVIHATLAGMALELGRIDLATFENPSGLEQVGGTYFAASGNSGTASVTEPGNNGTGSLASSTLEMSNVDLSQEFADMITTQRGFQANSRMITVSDTLLEELINLKR